MMNLLTESEMEAALVVEELREFVRCCDSAETPPGSRLAQERALARLAICAYEETQSRNLDAVAPIGRDAAHERRNDAASDSVGLVSRAA